MKFIALISDGIDSPVAGHLLTKRGAGIVYVHFDIGENETKKVVYLIRAINDRFTIKTRLYVISHSVIQKKIRETCNPHYTCVLCKRMMYRIAQKIAEKEGADALITGDSLGQVASQTLNNLAVESRATTLPILRPLIGMDKEEIIQIAKAIGTYEISIKDACACPFVPSKPKTHSDAEKVLEEEQKMAVDALVENAVNTATLVEV